MNRLNDAHQNESQNLRPNFPNTYFRTAEKFFDGPNQYYWNTFEYIEKIKAEIFFTKIKTFFLKLIIFPLDLHVLNYECGPGCM